MINKMLRTSRALVVGVFLFGSALPVFALASGGIGALPGYPDPTVKYSDSWFIYNLNPGETKEDGVLVFNRSEQEETIRVYSVDAIPSNQGNFALKKEDEESVGIGSWITLSEEFVTLAAGEERIIPFTITIPETADVGEHAGGIVVQKASIGESLGTGGASIQTRIGVRVYETVPGEIIRNISVSSFTLEKREPDNENHFSYYQLSLTVQNDSNISLKPMTALQVSGFGMKEYFERSKREGGFFLSDLTNFFKGEELPPFEWQLFRGEEVSTSFRYPVPAFGSFSFQAVMTYDDNGTMKEIVTPEITVTIIPWGLVIGFSLALLVLIGAFIFWRVMKGTKRWQTYTVKRGDTLFAIAGLSGVAFAKLMKGNKLTNPKLKIGQVIRVPRKFLKSQGLAAAAGDEVEEVPTLDVLKRPKGTKVPGAEKTNRRYLWLAVSASAVVVVLGVGYFATRMIQKPAPETAPAAEVKMPDPEPTQAVEAADITIGVVTAGSEKEWTDLLIERLRAAGFKAEETDTAVSETDQMNEQTVVRYAVNAKEKFDVFARMIISPEVYEAREEDGLAFDIVMGPWNGEDILWGEQNERARDLNETPDPELSVSIANASGVAGAAGKAADMLETNGYIDVEARNATESEALQSGLAILYRRNFKQEAESLAALLEYDYGTAELSLMPDAPVDLTVILGASE